MKASKPFRLYFRRPDGPTEDWGIVWMSQTELESQYLYSARQLVWVKRTDPTKFLQATTVKENEL